MINRETHSLAPLFRGCRGIPGENLTRIKTEFVQNQNGFHLEKFENFLTIFPAFGTLKRAVFLV